MTLITSPAPWPGAGPGRPVPSVNWALCVLDDTPKPAAALLAPGADLTVAPLPAYARFLKPFWLTVLAGLVLVPLLFAAVAIWYLRRRVG